MKSTLAILVLSVTSLGAAPRLGVSTNTVGPVRVLPGALTAVQIVEAFNLGDGTLNLTATSSASWLSATVGASRACTTRTGNCFPLNISVNPAGLTPGTTYTEFVTLSDPNAIDSPQDIAVTVNLAGVPSSITSYVTPVGGLTASMTFPLYPAGTGLTGTVTTQSGGNWLKFLNTSGSIVSLPYPYAIQTAAQVGMATGTYTGTIVITGSTVASDNKTVNVTLNVTSSPIIQLDGFSTVRLNSASPSSSLTFNNVGSGTLAITGATSSAAFLKPTASGNGVTLTADPTGLAPGIYSANVTLTSNAANNALVSVPVEFTVMPAGQPVISAGGIVNIANYAAEGVAPGDIVAVFGAQFAPAGTSATNPGTPPLATTLGGAQVLVNGVPAPLYYVSPTQINFQVPYSLTAGSAASVQVVSNGTPGNTRSLSIVATAARVLNFGANYGIIVNNADGSLTVPSNGPVPGHPAKPGDILVVYSIGLGQTNPAAVEGQAAVGQPISGVTVMFGGGFSGAPITVNALFAGLTPTAVGLYQVNVTVPPDAPTGSAIPLVLNVNGTQSPVVYLAITATGR